MVQSLILKLIAGEGSWAEAKVKWSQGTWEVSGCVSVSLAMKPRLVFINIHIFAWGKEISLGNRDILMIFFCKDRVPNIYVYAWHAYFICSLWYSVEPGEVKGCSTNTIVIN